MAQKNTKYMIIDTLMGANAGKTALSAKCKISSAKASKELDELMLVEVVKKTPHGKEYCLNPEILYVILKLYADSAEIIAFSSQNELQRISLDTVYSMSPDENLALFAQTAKEYCKAFAEKYFSVVPCIICESEKPSSTSGFALIHSRAELLASAVSNRYPNESVLYINLDRPFCAICGDGRTCAFNSALPSAPLESIRHTLSLLRPSTVLLDGKENEALEKICKELNVRFCTATSAIKGIQLDEFEMLLRVISSPLAK